MGIAGDRSHSDHMTTAAIIQARMGSIRFPGKVLAQLAGKPVLQHVIERAKVIPGVDLVIVAFPAEDASIPIFKLANDLGVSCASGSEKNVLSRYWDAAKIYGVTGESVIVRITADCPLFSPKVAGEVLTMLKLQAFDYASNVFPRRTYPMGLDCEAFTWDCLDAAHTVVRHWHDKEHVTPWMQRTKGLARGCVCQRKDQSNENWCVDYP
jgi:spore coat polysaccharide biosynthesis protein SpsF (cytidylyltransferase family)